MESLDNNALDFEEKSRNLFVLYLSFFLLGITCVAHVTILFSYGFWAHAFYSFA